MGIFRALEGPSKGRTVLESSLNHCSCYICNLDLKEQREIARLARQSLTRKCYRRESNVKRK